ncbi:AAA domain-containing protein [Actinoplanes sp. NPDC049802]|uniref:DEAD/DEAH box helicase n=1 Tax=Actinoplanes sp. NPDC049802 TaxID=3154742 RepID=UPI0033FCAB4C
MHQLLEQRSALEGAVHAGAIVVGEEIVAGRPAIRVRLDTPAEFAEGRNVAIDGPALERPASLRILSRNAGGDGPSLALEHAGTPLPAGTQLHLEQQGRFALSKHSLALRRFLDEQVEGNWEHLALLLHTPDRLPAPEIPALQHYFDQQLTTDQRAAVDGAVGSPHTFHVQGPPGTGKTTVITEVVRQLTARGERVLLLAPMHVAVDEVLRRVADEPGILALRISWDESRVAEDLRRFLPEQVTHTYLRQARRPATSQADRWRTEIEQLRRRCTAIEEYIAATAHHRTITAQLQAAEDTYGQWRSRLTASLARLRTDTTEAEQRLSTLTAESETIATAARSLRRQLDAVPWWRRSLSGVQNVLGATDAVARLTADYRDAEAKRRHNIEAQRQWTARHATTAAQLADAENERWHGEPAHQRTIERRREEADAGKAAVADAGARLAIVIGPRADSDLARLHEKLDAQIRQLQHRIELEQRWFDLSGAAAATPETFAEQIAEDLRRTANLICCTTTGINRDLGDSDFDTLIVDEASRVVDSEFLIGAVRARRWVLVGDEHQLPPYVEPADEHHLHALSALHQVALGKATDLPAAVRQLGRLWTEDEEIHQFRTETVLRRAEQLDGDGTWQREYRPRFTDVWSRLRGLGDDPERTLLSAMRDHLVLSQFERSVVAAPPALRHRLRVQRRMIAPIAEIVAGPVYGGDYLSPEPADVPPLPYGGTNTPVVFVDTSVYGDKAAERLSGNGFVNDKEAECIARMCLSWDKRLRRSGSAPVTVSVLTFYRGQAAEIRRRLGWPGYPDFRVLSFNVIDAIDKIQGQESDLVFLSFCRTFLGQGRPSARYGRWLQDVRRLNVACTRARSGLILVGHQPTLRRLNGVPEAEEFYRNLFHLLSENPDFGIAKGVQ